MSKLDSIMNLADGWDGPESRAVDKVAYTDYLSFIRLFDRVPSELEPMPTTAGGLRMEWDRGDFSYVAEIESGGTMFLCAIGPSESDDFEAELPTVDAERLLAFYTGETIG